MLIIAMMTMTRIMMKNEEDNDKKRNLKRSSEKQTNPPLNMIINQTTWSRLKVCRLKPELIEAPPPPFKHPFKAHVYT